jgi:hypothetical protein
MSLDAATITKLSRTIAEDFNDPELEVVGVAATHGGSDRVELLVSDGERVRMLNLTRTRKADFERDLRSRLEEGLKWRSVTRIG